MAEEKITPRDVLANPENFKCGCRVKNCPLFGKCAECIAVHRYFKVLTGCMEGITTTMDQIPSK
jgi:hypothetical protein